jgi:SWI/SNF-related matrix-associated actin-dependent regulator 1 of chromatin subfamily A
VLSEADLEAAAGHAAGLAQDDETVVAVMPADPFGRGLVYLCALAPPGHEETVAWVAVDPGGSAVGDERLVREAATLTALCETGEEAAAALDADAVAAAARHALALAGEEDEALRHALAGLERAASELADTVAGIRVAEAGYLDALAACAGALAAAVADLQPLAEELSSTLSGEPGDPRDELARATWEGLGRVVAGGMPSRYAETIGAATGAVSALGDDVVRRWRRPRPAAD